MQPRDPRSARSRFDPPSGTVVGRLISRLLHTPAWRAGCWSGFAAAGVVYATALMAGDCEAQLLSGLAMGLMIAVLYSDEAGDDGR